MFLIAICAWFPLLSQRIRKGVYSPVCKSGKEYSRNKHQPEPKTKTTKEQMSVADPLILKIFMPFY